MKKRPIVLVDMDGVIADWYTGLREVTAMLAPLRAIPDPLADIPVPPTFIIATGTDEAAELVRDAMAHGSLYARLKPIDGALEALTLMQDLFDVRICSTPDVSNAACSSAKIAWLHKYVGIGLAKSAILTHDKTIIRGDVLIDDKPEIDGVHGSDPEWTRIVFDAAYNQDSPGPRMAADWSNWRDIVETTIDAGTGTRAPA